MMKRTTYLILIATAVVFIHPVYALTTLTVDSYGSGVDDMLVVTYTGTIMNVYAGERNVTYKHDDDPAISFETFCIEINEPIELETYEAFLGTEAVGGGAGPPPSPENPFDPLDPETAWIYETYHYGNSFGWNAVDVQLAIWLQEDEILYTPRYDLTNAESILSLAEENANGLGDVHILNLWTPPGGSKQYPVQDVLMIVPEPASLLLFALGGMILRRKRSSKIPL